MSKNLTKEQVYALARLARLSLTEEEIETYRKDLSSILDYFETLNTANTDGVEPTSQITGLENVTREDRVKKQPTTPEELLKSAPASQSGYIKVRRMI